MPGETEQAVLRRAGWRTERREAAGPLGRLLESRCQGRRAGSRLVILVVEGKDDEVLEGKLIRFCEYETISKRHAPLRVLNIYQESHLKERC